MALWVISNIHALLHTGQPRDQDYPSQMYPATGAASSWETIKHHLNMKIMKIQRLLQVQDPKKP